MALEYGKAYGIVITILGIRTDSLIVPLTPTPYSITHAWFCMLKFITCTKAHLWPKRLLVEVAQSRQGLAITWKHQRWTVSRSRPYRKSLRRETTTAKHILLTVLVGDFPFVATGTTPSFNHQCYNRWNMASVGHLRLLTLSDSLRQRFSPCWSWV